MERCNFFLYIYLYTGLGRNYLISAYSSIDTCFCILVSQYREYKHIEYGLSQQLYEIIKYLDLIIFTVKAKTDLLASMRVKIYMYICVYIFI